MRKLLLLLSLFCLSNPVFAISTPYGQIDSIHKGLEAQYDGYIVDQPEMDHMITVSEEKENLEAEKKLLDEQAQLKEIEKQDIQNQNKSLEKEVEKEKATVIIVGILATIAGIFTGGALSIIFHLVK
jgi:hypothetical protein